MNDLKVIEVEHDLFLPDWNCRALISKNGLIKIHLNTIWKQPVYYSKNEFINSSDFDDLNPEHRQARLSLFDDLQEWYENKKKTAE